MLKLSEPKNVLHFFEEISKIPHGSGNEKEISDYLYSFAKDRGLWVKQDEALNIIIKKPASKGKEKSEPVIIQGHMDMVCEKNMDTDHNFKKDPLKLYTEGDFLKARGTTLGADNGIAVAMALALLDAEDYPHPPLEVVVTTEEEVGLIGARELDAGILDGKRLINLDSGEEGHFCSSCAGGMRTYLYLPVETMDNPQAARESYVLKVAGLQGGHSGIDINKERANGIHILGRALAALQSDFDIYLWDICGGLADNVIPREAQAFFTLPTHILQAVEQKVKALESTYRQEYRTSDTDLYLSLEKASCEPESVYTTEFSKKIIAAILLTPVGPQAMSLDVPGLVETSNNLGGIRRDKNEVELTCAIRSSVVSRKQAIKDQILQLAVILGGRVECYGDYPGWEYAPVSPLRDTFGHVYEKRYGKQAMITAIHAGLECGHFSEKIPGIDIISLGPDIFGAHSPEECLSISSLQRTWEFFIEVISLL